MSMFSPYDFKKNENIILSYFKDEWKWQNKLILKKKKKKIIFIKRLIKENYSVKN